MRHIIERITINPATKHIPPTQARNSKDLDNSSSCLRFQSLFLSPLATFTSYVTEKLANGSPEIHWPFKMTLSDI